MAYARKRTTRKPAKKAARSKKSMGFSWKKPKPMSARAKSKVSKRRTYTPKQQTINLRILTEPTSPVTRPQNVYPVFRKARF